ncbi:MAG: HmuY family protein [Bacteroidia bacterium]|nr:HmuY family protein [Bacteroidia bacterium]
MKAFRNIILISSGVLLFSSCFKEDKPVDYKPLTGITNTAATKSDYSMQVYYDMETNSFVGENHRENWDLSFSNVVAGDWDAKINSAKKMRVYITQDTDISLASSVPTVESDWRYDDYELAEGIAMDIRSSSSNRDKVHILDLGVTTLANPIGYKKIKMLNSSSDSYSFEVAELNGSGVKTFSVHKNSDYNFMFFSFKDGGKFVNIEPMRNTFDLIFTQYTDRAYYANGIDFEWYNVNGILFNAYGNMEAAVDSGNIAFEQVTSATLASYTFNPHLNAMGYNWKKFNFDTQTYEIEPYVYMVRDRKGEYYKMRFLSFVNAQGEKGYPTFEISKL